MATMTSSMHRPCDSGIRCRSMSQSPNLTGFSTRELGPSEGGSGTISAGEFRSRRTRLSTEPSSHQSFRDGKEHATDEPTVILVGARSPTLLPRPLVSHVPFSPSTLHAPLVQASDDSESPRSLNPPPPVAITVSSASSAQDSSHSRTSIKRLPRLPTPDFTSLKSIPYKEALIAPLNFLRRGLGYQEPNSLSDAKETLQVPPSMESHLPNPLSDFPEQTTSAAMEHIDSSRSSASDASTVHSAQTSGSQSECSIRLVPQFRNRSRYVPQDHRHGSECNDEDTEKLIYRSDFQDETNSSFSNPRRSIGLQVPASRQPGLTSPNLAIGSILPTLQQTSARFTQKFPLWGLARTQQVRFHPLKGEGSSPDGVLASSNGLHTDTSQIYLDDGTFGFERIGRWSRFKWILLLSVMTVFVSGICALLISIYTWFGAWPQARSVTTVDFDIIIFLTLAGSTLVLTSLLGFAGTLLNSRPILAFYSVLLWPSLVSVLIVGYTSYKRRTFNLEGKLSEGWSRVWDDSGRALIQLTFRCCGFYGPGHDFALTKTCYPRAPLPGCKGKLLRFEKFFLQKVYTIVFLTVPIHIANIVISLLCSNHVNKTFGKGLTPKAYRLSLADVKANAEKIMARLSETHIPDHPEWTQERKVKDFVTDRPARLRRDEEVYVLEEGGEWEKYPFEDDPGHYHLQRNSRPVR